jgi:hypothetical protein
VKIDGVVHDTASEKRRDEDIGSAFANLPTAAFGVALGGNMRLLRNSMFGRSASLGLLPRRRQREARWRRPTAPTTVVRLGNCMTQKRVLIVDDERVITDTLVMIFSQEGYESKGVYSAEQALLAMDDWLPAW